MNAAPQPLSCLNWPLNPVRQYAELDYLLAAATKPIIY